MVHPVSPDRPSRRGRDFCCSFFAIFATQNLLFRKFAQQRFPNPVKPSVSEGPCEPRNLSSCFAPWSGCPKRVSVPSLTTGLGSYPLTRWLVGSSGSIVNELSGFVPVRKFRLTNAKNLSSVIFNICLFVKNKKRNCLTASKAYRQKFFLIFVRKVTDCPFRRGLRACEGGHSLASRRPLVAATTERGK